MEFEAKVLKSGTVSKPKTTISSKAFDITAKASVATHIRIKETGEFVPITEDLVIKRKKDENGNPKNEVVHFSKIDNNEKSEFVCVREGKESVIDGQFYTQVVFMKKSEKGSYLRCDDGCYVHHKEPQVPAFKKVPLTENAKLSKPVHNYEFYIEREELVFGDNNNPKRITLPNERVRKEGDKYQYLTEEGKWVDCKYTKGVDSRVYVTHLLIDGDKVVDIKKLREHTNGDFVLEGVNGDDVVVGKREVKLENSIVESTTVEATDAVIIPHNVLKQRVRLEEGLNLAFRWATPEPNGLCKVDVNRNRTKVVFDYGTYRIIYAQHNVEFTTKPNDRVIRVNRFNVLDLGEDGIKIEFLNKIENVAQEVVFENGNPVEYSINNKHITDIVWEEVDGYKQIKSYTIDGTVVSDIEWQHGEIKSCKVHLFDEDGNVKVVEVNNMQMSEYQRYAIKCNLVEKIEDLKIEDGKVSFKMGDYKFTDAEIRADNAIGKCKLRHNGKEEEIDLSIDPRFKQLKVAVEVAFTEHNITPLIQSKLMEKVDGKYQLIADVVLDEAMTDVVLKDGEITKATKNKGVARATEISSVDQALKKQDAFKDKPFKTVVIDQNGRKHTISDFNTKYEGAIDFELSNDILVDMIGKDKMEIKKGELKVDDKKAKGRTDDMIVMGFWMCSNPLFLVFGIPMLYAGAVYGVASSIKRSNKQKKLENMNADEVKRDIQENAKENCKTQINNLVDQYKRQAEAYKKLYSQEEYDENMKALREEFKFEYIKEIAKLQILGGGAMKCEFDPMKKDKLTPLGHLAYLEYKKKRAEFENGKPDSPILATKLATELEGLEGYDRLEREVELLQLYGGREGQLRAHKLKMDNINHFRELEDAKRATRGKAGIEPEDFVKQLNAELNQGRMVWGGIEDKLLAFKNSKEYLIASKKEREEMLTEKREALQKEAKSLKIDTVVFNEMFDKDGKPVVEKITQSLTSYMEYVDMKLGAGDIKGIEKFTLDFYDKLSEEEKELHTSTTLSESTARLVETTDMRKIEFDRVKSNRVGQKIIEKQSSLEVKIDEFTEDVKSFIGNASYEDLIKFELDKEARMANWIKSYTKSEELIDIIPCAELNDDTTTKISRNASKGYVAISKIKIQIQQAKQQKEEEYKKQVKKWAKDEFIQRHNNAYLEFIDKNFVEITKSGKKRVTASSVIIDDNFIDYMKKSLDKESVSKELETLEVKHNIEDSASAEVYCDTYNEEYKKFIEERNAKSTTGELDPNSEIAKCYYYAYCKRDNPVQVEKFVKYSNEKRKIKIKEMLSSNTLPNHKDKKIIKLNNAQKSAEASVAPVAPTVSASADAGLTA